MFRVYTSTIIRSGELNIVKYFGTSASLHQKRNTKVKKEKIPSDDPQKEECDCIGPSDPLSNLRVVRYYVPSDETPLEYKYRMDRIQTNEWNQNFWSEHNIKFKKMKEDFISKKLKEKYGEDEKSRKTLSAEEMSQFYKFFLDENRSTHLQYNKEWYKQNFHNLILAARVWVEQTFKTRRK